MMSVHSRSNCSLEVLVFKERGTLEYPEKTSWSKGENQQQTQLTSHMLLTPGFEPGPHWRETSALTTAHACSPT